MAKPLPSLALDMSQDGISLHQLAFDGHWHELSRVALTDAALRARLANMRQMGANLEGRHFKTRIWLPEAQIFQVSAQLSGFNDTERLAQAREAIVAAHGGKPADYLYAIGGKEHNNATAVAAVRLLTLKEARHFAKSHGFTARGYSTRTPLEGFKEAPVFHMPLEKGKLAGLGLLATAAAALVVVGGYAFYKTDPLNMWEMPPRAADFAPFQQPNPGIERAQAPALPAALPTPAPVATIANLASDPSHAGLPYLPPRQLTAEAQTHIQAPTAPSTEVRTQDLHMAAAVAVNWPSPIAALPKPAPADDVPEMGFVNVATRVTAPPLPKPDSPPAIPAPLSATPARQPKPITVANTAFYLEPLPAMATRLSPEALAAFAEKTGLSIAQLSQRAQPILLIESKLVKAISGLPPLMPRLRSGRPIPAQVAPPVVPTPPPTPAPLFAVVNGQPAIIPPLRPKPPEARPASLSPTLPYRLISGAPDPKPILRPQSQPPTAAPTSGFAPAAPVTITLPNENAAMAAAVDAALAGVAPPDANTGAPFVLRQGQPALLPRLRSGGAIPALVFANAAPAPDQATAAANALRPLRRPQAIVALTDPMISSAAPITAVRPGHRNAAFSANVARITALTSSRPRTASPSVPADPRSVNLPTSASVARAATIENAINLRKTNLLGIYGTEDNRTALIRLSHGQLVRVQRGQSFSGWTVVAISTDTVQVQKRNRQEILRMPAE